MVQFLNNFGSYTKIALSWASSLLFWAGILLFFATLFIIFLIVKRNRKFQYPLLEVVSLGQGKIAVYKSKAGWFKSKRNFFGLIESGGEQELICKDGKRKIFCASSEDYHEIDGSRGLIVKRKDDDPEILVPLNRVDVRNLNLILSIAPADYRDAAVDVLEKKRQETMGWLEKNAPVIVMTALIVFSLIALVIVFNFAKGESSAWREFAESIRGMGTVITNSSAP